MSGRPPRVLHIGQRKTATSWLQQAASRAREAGVVAAEHGKLVAWTREARANVASDADYAAMAAVLPDHPTLPAFASSETLIAYDPKRMAEAVARRWPDAQILVTTRAPQDYVLSSFHNNSIRGHEHAASYARRLSRNHMRRSHDLDGVAAAYGEVFGAGAVHFLPFELLRDDKAAYVSRLEALMGFQIGAFLADAKRNASPPPAFLVIARSVNALVAEEAPHVLETMEWTNFMRFASVAAAHSRGDLEEFCDGFLRNSRKVAEALPRLDRETQQRIAGRMRVVEQLPDYQPYLKRYGLLELEAPKPEDPAGASGDIERAPV